MGIADRPSSRLGRKYQWIPGGRATAKPGPNNPPGNPGGVGNPGGTGTPSPPGGGGPRLTSPTGTTTGPDTADLTVSTNGSNGTLYFVISTSSTAPTKAQVKAGQMHTGAAAADSGSQAVTVNGVQTITGGATGLTPETIYFAHYMHERANGSQSGIATSASFETEADGDPELANVKFLSGFEGADAGTTFTDESPSARTMTANGNAQTDTAQFVFGVSSLLCDGTGDYVSAADSADWVFDGEFTVEGFVRLAVMPDANGYCLVGQRGDNGSVGWQLHVLESATTQSFHFGFSTDGSSFAHDMSSSDLNFAINTWYYFCVDRDASNKIRMYWGTTGTAAMVGSKDPATGTSFNSTSPLTIGQNARSVSVMQPLNGWLDELRITKGVARYATDAGVTIPIEAFHRT